MKLLRLSSSPVGGPWQSNGCSRVEMQLGQARAESATEPRKRQQAFREAVRALRAGWATRRQESNPSHRKLPPTPPLLPPGKPRKHKWQVAKSCLRSKIRCWPLAAMREGFNPPTDSCREASACWKISPGATATAKIHHLPRQAQSSRKPYHDQFFLVSRKKPAEETVTPTPTNPGRQATEARVLFPPSRKPSSAEEWRRLIHHLWSQAQSSRKPHPDQFSPVSCKDRRHHLRPCRPEMAAATAPTRQSLVPADSKWQRRCADTQSPSPMDCSR